MQTEIIAVGTEILLGQIVDTNTTFVSQQLAELGINVYYQTVVGDNEKRMLEVINTAVKRSDLIILTGGLGPTKDDLTKQVVASYLNKELIEDSDAMKKIVERFKISGRTLTPNNRLQALYIDGSMPLKNATGLAVGDFYRNPKGPNFLLLPGPPNELKPMMLHEAKPLLAKEYNVAQILESRVLRFFGIGESQLATKLSNLIDSQTNPTMATYAKDNEVTLRLTASADTRQKAAKLLDDTENEVMQCVGKYMYGYGDENSLPKVVIEKLKEQNLTITGAESLTGGQFQAAITNIPGASKVFPGGFVTYANEAKVSLLDIPQTIIDTKGVVSEATAIWMAKQAKAKLKTDIGVSFTGVAGPESLEGQPAGTVWIGIAFKDRPVVAYEYRFSRSRKFVQERAVLTAFSIINNEL
ncbi:competence/damage-inducible protein A [Ligilactobacillus sp. WILCCON 0076]|uniref:Putative competence-damage inducible protein n=1 Tax=Ligilactobacillus ubinensis TaxID=2876789 RepID=A0A9X2FM08_9LACO|nr:competence/damage-inducible protein A [Ligilactobacillus ubinensis]MCP0887725.1 competence/damage-inducible protein A [Ligilactobacillus ubinensis]